MPATINHQTPVDESDQDSHLSATATAAVAVRANAQPPSSDVLFGTSSVGTEAAQITTAEANGHCSEPFAEEHEPPSRDHSCVTLGYDEYFVAIKRNVVVEAYCRAWHTEPAWLPRVCGLSLRPINCTENYVNGSANGSAESPASEGSLAHILTELSSGPRPKNAVIANAHYISHFLVPAGMPYMVSMSPVFGLIIRTPFYSTIPSAFPDIPDALFSMRNLTIARVIQNPVFRHELVFNSKLKVEAPSQLADAINSRPFWRQLEHETEQIMAHPIARAPTPMLPIFLNETKKIMLGVVPCSLSSQISFYFDTERLLDGSEATDSQMLDDLLTFIHAILDACVLPIRKHWVQRMQDLFRDASDSPSALVAGFRIAIWLVNQTKIDFINAQVKERTASLNESVIPVEKEFYEALLAKDQSVALEATEWLARQPTICELRKMCNLPNDCVPRLRSDMVSCHISRLVAGFVWSVLRRSRSEAATPTMFALDKRRIKSMQHQLNNFVLERLEADVSAGCPEKYRPHLPRLMSGKELEQSPLFLLIERRVLGSVALQAFKKIVGAATPNERLQPERHQTSFPQESSGLAALTDDISTLLALHWRAAGFLYDAVDQDQGGNMSSGRTRF